MQILSWFIFEIKCFLASDKRFNKSTFPTFTHNNLKIVTKNPNYPRNIFITKTNKQLQRWVPTAVTLTDRLVESEGIICIQFHLIVVSKVISGDMSLCQLGAYIDHALTPLPFAAFRKSALPLSRICIKAASIKLLTVEMQFVNVCHSVCRLSGNAVVQATASIKIYSCRIRLLFYLVNG